MGAASNLWQRLGGAPDPRSDREVAGDIDAELAFHLEQRERELIAQGLTSEAARSQALQRFGDFGKVRAECRRIQLGGKIMLQRVTLVALVVLLAAVGWLGLLNFTSRRAAKAEINSLKAQISRLERAAASPTEAQRDLESITEDVRSGRGTLGKLLQSEFLRSRLENLQLRTSETRVFFDKF